MKKINKIKVQGFEIEVISNNYEEYISLTDMMRAKDGEFFISDWIRNRNTLEFIGIWEKINNPLFNYGEFAIIKSQADLNSFKISINAEFIKMGLLQKERLIKLNETAITQMGLLLENKNVSKLLK